MYRHLFYIVVLLGLLNLGWAEAATITLREAGGDSQFSAELGTQLEMEVVVDTEGEEVNGYVFFLSFDADVLRPLQDADGQGSSAPFKAGGFLNGIVLVNQIEEIDGEVFLGYGEAAGAAVPRQSANGQGVAARFKLEVLRRPPGDTVFIRVEERGHDRTSNYVGAANPGTEKRFNGPLGEAAIRVTGFRILPLPDVVLIESESQVVFNLDDFVEQAGAEVFWTNSILSEIPTLIDSETRQVTMEPQAGLFGTRRMIFTALEQNEGLTAADTINIEVRSPPRIDAFRDSVVFAEDGTNQDLDLDAFVSDLDDITASLQWSHVGSGGNVQVEISSGRIALFSATPDWFGREQVQFRVEDGDGLSDTTSTLVVVTPVNDPPEAVRPDPIYPVVGADPVRVPLSQLLQDKDDDLENLQIELAGESGVRVEIEGDSLVIYGNDPGRSTVDFTVRDAAGAVASSRLVVVVLEPGGTIKPEIGSVPALRLKGGQTGTVELNQYVQDDSPVADLSWGAAADSGITATLAGSVLTVNGESGFVGASKVDLTVTDPQGNQDTAVLAVHLLSQDEDPGPQIAGPGKVGVVAAGETQISLDDLVADPDHADGDIAWQVEGAADLEVEIDAETRTLKVKAADGLSGSKTLKLIATDPTGFADTIDVPVLVAAAQGEPQMGELPAATLEDGTDQLEIDLDDFAFDGEDNNAELLWTAVAQAGLEAEIDPVSHVLTVRRVDGEGPPVNESQVFLQVQDTRGGEASVFLQVALPPLFELGEIPDIEFFTGEIDSSLVLDNFVISQGDPPILSWKESSGQHLAVRIDSLNAPPHRVHIKSIQASFQGSETLWFTATDTTSRTRTASVRVRVKGTGLRPQISPFPRIEIFEGEVNTDIDLDDFVVDDDPNSRHQWSFSGQQNLVVELDPETHQVTLRAEGVEPGIEQIQFLVRDPAENVALAVLEVAVLRGGGAPVIGPLPQLFLPAGGDEDRLGLDAFVSDPDTPVEQIIWEVTAGAGIGARIEDRRLFVLVPNGQSGTRQLQLKAHDPQGNLAMAVLQIVILEDAEAPELGLQIARHPVFDELVELHIQASETLREDPAVQIDDDATAVKNQGEDRYLATYQAPRLDGEQYIDITLSGFDMAGNEATRQQTVGLRWMGDQGGSLGSPDLQVRLNVPGAAAAAGRLALLYRLDEREVPPGSEGEAIYAADILGDRETDHPVNLNFFVGSKAQPDLGILRWNEDMDRWEEVPTRVDDRTGWLAASVRSLGLFKVGTVSSNNRLANEKLSNYPNPFVPDIGETTQIVYELSGQGRVKVEIFNMLGQKVRVLVDEFQDVGTWSAVWDGNDANGRRLSSGSYLYELTENGQRHCRSMLLLK
jgi:hypothetical protein